MKTPIRNCFIILLAGGCLLGSTGFARGQSTAPDAPAIQQTAEEFHQALGAGKAERVIELLQPDALIAEGGHVQTRDEYQSEHLAADIAFARAVPGKELSALVRQEGDVAWVTSTFKVSGRYKDKAINELAAETMVLTKTAEGWRVRAIHWSSQKATK